MKHKIVSLLWSLYLLGTFFMFIGFWAGDSFADAMKVAGALMLLLSIVGGSVFVNTQLESGVKR